MLTVTAEDFDMEILQSDKPVLLDFWAPWCSYCRKIEPAMKQLEKDYEGKVIVGKVNVDEQRKLAVQFQIETLPTLILLKKGEESERRLIAPESRASIEGWLVEQGALD